MNKHEYLKKVSKIGQTEEDEFKADYNSPERMWEYVIKPEKKRIRRRSESIRKDALLKGLFSGLSIGYLTFYIFTKLF